MRAPPGSTGSCQRCHLPTPLWLQGLCHLPASPRGECGKVGLGQLLGGTWCRCASLSPMDGQRGATFTSRLGEEEPVLCLQLLRGPRCWWPKQNPARSGVLGVARVSGVRSPSSASRSPCVGLPSWEGPWLVKEASTAPAHRPLCMLLLSDLFSTTISCFPMSPPPDPSPFLCPLS